MPPHLRICQHSAESDLHRWLEAVGFKKIEINVVAAEEQPPHFQTLLASGEK